MNKIPRQEKIKDVLEETVRNLNAERGSLMLVDNAKDELYIQVSCSTNPETELKDDVLRTTRVKIGKGISGIVAKTQKPLIINDIRVAGYESGFGYTLIDSFMVSDKEIKELLSQ